MAFEWMGDKNKVKDIFDHTRNFLICGAILYASLRIMYAADTYKYGAYLAWAIGLSLFCFFQILVIANVMQGVKLLFPDLKDERSWRKRTAVVALIVFYFLAAAQIVDSVMGVKSGDHLVEESLTKKPNQSPKPTQ